MADPGQPAPLEMVRRRTKRTGLRFRVSVAILVSFAVATLAFRLLVEPWLLQRFLDQQVQEVEIRAANVASELEIELRGAIGELERAAMLSAVVDLEPTPVGAALDQIDRVSTYLHMLTALDKAGRIVASPSDRDDEGRWQGNREEFAEAMRTGRTFVSDLRRSSSGRVGIAMGTPIRDASGTIRGVLAATLRLQDLNPGMYQAVLQPTLPKDWQVLVATPKGSLIAHSHLSRLVIDHPLEPFDHPMLQPDPPAASGPVPIDLDGVRWYTSVARVAGANWTVVVQAPQSELVARVSAFYRPLMLFAGATAVFVLLAVLVAVARFLEPLDSLTASLEHYGRTGNVAPVRVAGSNEVAAALDAFNEMIRERGRAREQLEASEARLRRGQKMEAVGRLAGGVAHDFNNLLTSILGYAALVLDDLPESSPLRADVEQIRQAGVRASTLTRQLLAFSRRLVLVAEVLDVRDVVVELEPMLRRLLGEHITCDMEVPSAPCPVLVDRGQLEQVILNLVLNARDAMPDGGRLSLQVRVVEPSDAPEDAGVAAGARAQVAIAISDTGVGMNSETLSHLFEPFFTTKERPGATGLGLATVYGIVEQSGGTVGVESEVGRGTTVRVFLPRSDEDEVATAGTPAGAAARGSEVVLVVEDEEALRQMVGRVLADAGYSVFDAKDAESAIEVSRATAGPIDLLLTDVVMPGLPGPELARRLLAERPGLKVLYMSGYTDRALPAGGSGTSVDLIQKPFTPAAIAGRVRALLDRDAASGPDA
jgi:two-component system cell cycle sensor histidine kinase/response regulator CckA